MTELTSISLQMVTSYELRALCDDLQDDKSVLYKPHTICDFAYSRTLTRLVFDLAEYVHGQSAKFPFFADGYLPSAARERRAPP